MEESDIGGDKSLFLSTEVLEMLLLTTPKVKVKLIYNDSGDEVKR